MTRGVKVVPGEDRSVALALVNSWHLSGSGEVDHLDAEWLGAHELPVPDDLTRLIKLRSAVRELFLAVIEERAPTGDAVDVVNAAALDQPTAPQLTWPPERHWHNDSALTTVARDAIEVVCGSFNIHQCEAHSCVRLYFREHARRRWCSTACGDRVRAMRHHKRQQSEE
jgi:predicted RNA-binding Zn ribbon-like protein